MGLDLILGDHENKQIDLPEEAIQECCELFDGEAAERLRNGRLSDALGPFFYAELLGFVLNTIDYNLDHPEYKNRQKLLFDLRTKFDMDAANDRFLEYTRIINERYRERKSQKGIWLSPIREETDPEQFRKEAREWVGILFLTPELVRFEQAELCREALEALIKTAIELENTFEQDENRDSAQAMHGLIFSLYMLDQYMDYVINHPDCGYIVSY